MGRQREYRIGQLARHCGVSARTVDYYTDLGLLAPRQRTAGNYRLYGEEAVERLELVRLLRRQGWSLAEIREALAAAGPGLPASQWVRLEALVRAMRCEVAALRGAEPCVRGLGRDRRWRARVARTSREIVAHATLLSQTLVSLIGEHQAPVA